MSSSQKSISDLQPPLDYSAPQSLKTVYAVFMFLGVVAFALTLMNNETRAWYAYLTAFFYFVSLSVGGLFFASVQHLTSAGWSVNIRRLTESLTSFIPLSAVFGLIFLIGAPQIYSWLDPEIVAKDYLIQHKAPYLNMTFFVIRIVAFFGLMIFFTKKIVGYSLKQDESGDENLTRKAAKMSIPFILLFALSYSVFSIDTLMTLEPHWFSTIFGVYTFAGLFQSTMAFLILLTLYLLKKGHIKNYVDQNHLHDLGKFLFAFTVFWAYIAFSQFMLIWYANLPEETLFFIPRMEGSWAKISVMLIIFKFIVPFLALLSRRAKRSPASLAVVSILVLIMQYVDIYWLVYPNYDEHGPVFSFTEFFIFLGFAGLFLLCVSRFLSKHKLIPVKDPRIHESLNHHVVY